MIFETRNTHRYKFSSLPKFLFSSKRLLLLLYISYFSHSFVSSLTMCYVFMTSIVSVIIPMSLLRDSNLRFHRVRFKTEQDRNIRIYNCETCVYISWNLYFAILSRFVCCTACYYKLLLIKMLRRFDQILLAHVSLYRINISREEREPPGLTNTSPRRVLKIIIDLYAIMARWNS